MPTSSLARRVLTTAIRDPMPWRPVYRVRRVLTVLGMVTVTTQTYVMQDGTVRGVRLAPTPHHMVDNASLGSIAPEVRGYYPGLYKFHGILNLYSVHQKFENCAEEPT